MDLAEKLQRINGSAKLHRLVRESLPALVESGEPLDRKLIRLRRIADDVAKIVAPFTPCAKGCSACCHNPAIISELEAMQIAQSTGTPAATPKRVFDLSASAETRREYHSHHAGVACTFLKDGICSIYAHRPTVCRVQHSLEDSPSGCEGGRQPQSVDLAEILVSELRMMGRLMVYADIREFFPHKA
ncbi:MAG TPA: YkgJ family cysteine cluster protein [Burkholderiales bacterium]|nr:YkgJ family cysteine cluster protein [Burkholderiales bacterium]